MHGTGFRGRLGLVLAAFALAACSSQTPPPASSSPVPASPSAIASPSGAASLKPTPTPHPTPISLFSSWSGDELDNPAPDVYGGAYPNGVVAFRGGYVAVGGVNAGCCTGGFSTDTRALVWRGTTTGTRLTWQLLADRPEFALGHMRAIATNGERLVAVGWVDRESPMGADPTAAFWWSDDGETWTRIVSARGPIYDVTFTDGGFLALGMRTHEPGEGICEWGSRDGIHWDSYEARVGACGAGHVFRAVRPMPHGQIRIGSSETAALIWTSFTIDDIGGSSRSDDPSLARAIVRDATGTLLGENPHLVAIGSDAEGRPVAWFSRDGRAWELNRADAFASGQLEKLVTLADGSYLVVGESDAGGGAPGVRVWLSADGRTWSLVDFPAELGTGAEVFDAIPTTDGGVVIVGSHGEVGGFGGPLVLIGEP